MDNAAFEAALTRTYQRKRRLPKRRPAEDETDRMIQWIERAFKERDGWDEAALRRSGGLGRP